MLGGVRGSPTATATVPSHLRPDPELPATATMLATEHARPHATLRDRESRWWCCGISLRYAWRRHHARKASVAWLAQHVREAHRERGSLGAGRGPASLEETTALRIPTTAWTICGFSSCAYQELGAWGPYGWWLRRPPPPRPSACHPEPASHGESNQGLLLANSRLSRRLMSVSLHATHQAVPMLGRCRDRCRTFLEYVSSASCRGRPLSDPVPVRRRTPPGRSMADPL
jgi:hypothetical protein